MVCTYLVPTGAAVRPASQDIMDSTPLFLSSLRCSEDDRSLLHDCPHVQLGLASCDAESGYAAARCIGKHGLWFSLSICSRSFD